MTEQEEIIKAHKHCTLNERELILSEVCGCFYCLSIFSPFEIKFWINDKDKYGRKGRTAHCPVCSIDSVIGSSSDYPITEEFLEAMNAHWF